MRPVSAVYSCCVKFSPPWTRDSQASSLGMLPEYCVTLICLLDIIRYIAVFISVVKSLVQNEFCFINENAMRMKLGYFKHSCLTNCHKMLNYANFENGVTIFTMGILHVLLSSL